MNSKLFAFLFAVGTFAITLSYQNCSQNGFKVAKSDYLSSSSVFGSAVNLNIELPDSRVKDLQQQEENLGGSDTGSNGNNGGGVDNRKRVCYLSGSSGAFIKHGESRYVLEKSAFEPEQCVQVGTYIKLFEFGHKEVCNDGVFKTEPQQKKFIRDEYCGSDKVKCAAGTVLSDGVCKSVVCTQDVITSIVGGSCRQNCGNAGTSLSAKQCSCLNVGAVVNAGQTSCECPSGQVVVAGKCEVVVCSTSRVTTISGGGTCTETCENSGTKYGAKSCRCDADKSYNSATNSCECGSDQIDINGTCKRIEPGAVLFGGNYQCVNTYQGRNYLRNGSVDRASEVRMVVLKGRKVEFEDSSAAEIVYETSLTASNSSLKQDLLANKGYTAVKFPALTGEYTVIFYDPSYSTVNSVKYPNPGNVGYYQTRKVMRGADYVGQGVITLSNGVVVEGNESGKQLVGVTFILYREDLEGGSSALCEGHMSSPLVVDMRTVIKQGSKGIELTSQTNGIFFDILGENAKPVAHTKKQISWFEAPSRYMFLSLPNNSGQVNGINELFGDNTKGPDGKFAANGYAALAKFDSNNDRVIDDNDTVYSKLRLWADINKDGQSDSSELFTLSEAGLSSIDLDYDKNYSETDKFGNQTKMRSIVKFNNGAMRLIFDLWFNHK